MNLVIQYLSVNCIFKEDFPEVGYAEKAAASFKGAVFIFI